MFTIITNKLKIALVIALIVSINSCSSYPETPEKVVEKFNQYLSAGECEKAMELCIKNARETVQGSIDSGCETYETKIDSVTCAITEDVAICHCHETRELWGSHSFQYELVFVEGKWKIQGNGKDGDMGE